VSFAIISTYYDAAIAYIIITIMSVKATDLEIGE
jgi:hypothetical protein